MKCPFCGEPRRGESPAGVRYACGTVGPDEHGDYSTGHVCDIHQWSKVLREKDAEIARLSRELTAADTAMAKIDSGWPDYREIAAEYFRGRESVPSPESVGMLPMYAEQLGDEFDEKKGGE